MHVRTRLLRTAVVLLGVVVPAAAVTSTASAAGGRPLSTPLTGAEERPGPGDPDGSGTATLRVNPGQGQLCYTLSVSGIAAATAAHLHTAPAGSAGPVVVTLTAPTSGVSSGCVDIDRELARDIVRDPDDYYVNVHNAEFPAGAVRGQLGR